MISFCKVLRKSLEKKIHESGFQSFNYVVFKKSEKKERVSYSLNLESI